MSASDRTDARSEAILERITAVFARKGLDGASMQDFAAAADMSVGNFYRYYPSKLALVEAMIERCARDVRRDFDAVRGTGDVFEALRRLIEMNLETLDDDEAGLWLQVDAAAMRHPEIAALKAAMEAGIRADVRAMLEEALPAEDAVMAERLDDLADFMVILVGGLFQRFALADRTALAPRFARMTTLVVETARDRLAAIRAEAFRREAAE